MSGARVGLALGGGGARGLAHIGVLKVLERERIPVSVVAGTSMGALIGCLYAAGLGADRLEEEALRMASARRLFSLTDATLTRRGLFRGQRVMDYMRGLLGEVCFCDLATPAAVVAVDVRGGREVVLNEGDVVEAVRASIAIPGIFSPVERDGMLLIDGGVLNNVPADVARSLGADVVCAVDVNTNGGAVPFPGAREHRFLPTPIAETFDLLYCTLNLMMDEILRRRLEAAQPELLLAPDVPASITPLAGFTRAAEAIAAGEACAEQALPALRALLDGASVGGAAQPAARASSGSRAL